VLPLDEQFYRDEHLFAHLRHEVVMLDGEAIFLTRTEYRLLALLLERAGEIVPRAIIVTQMWGARPETHTRSLALHMGALRKKLGVYADNYVERVPRIGYRFRPAPGPQGYADVDWPVSLPPATTKG
jgi:two-component system KDP operon response regulator KdpE